MAIKVGGTTVINDSKKGIFETVNPGQYTTANRPSNPVEGDVIYDTDEKNIYVWNGVEWVPGGGGDFEPPILFSNTLNQDQVNGDRFTNNSFTSVLNNTGGDATDCLMTATVTGALAIQAGTQPITTNAYPGTSSTEVALTLEGTANLGDGVFEVNDVVKANESYTPETALISKVQTNSEIVGWTLSGFDINAGVYYTNPGQDYTSTLAFSGGTPGSSYIRFVVSNVEVTGCTITGDALDAPVVVDFSNVVNPGDGAAVTFFPTTASGDLLVSFTGSTGQTNIIKIDTDTSVENYGAQYALLAPSQVGPFLTLSSEQDIKLFQTDDVVQRTGWDQSYTWTEYWDSSFSLAAYAFDNNSATRAYDSDQYHTWTAPYTIPVNKQLRVRSATYSPGTTPENQIFEVNGVNYYNLLPEYVAGFTPWVVIPETELRTIRISGFGSGYEASVLGGVEVDGIELVDPSIPGNPGTTTKVTATNVSAKTITVDGGEWDTSNQSQVWSSGTKSGSTYRTYSWTAAFNGTITGSPGSAHTVIQASGDFTQLDFTGFSSISSVKVVYYGGTGGQIYINYGEPSQQLHAATTKGDPGEGVQPSHTFTASELKNIRLTNPSSDNAPYLYAIYVDGKLLVDAVIDNKVWSDQASGTFNVNGQPENLFDTDPSSGIYSNSGSQGQIDLTGINGVTKIEAYWYTGTNGNWTINVGGQDVNINPAHPNNGGGSGTLQWVDLTSLFTTPFDFGVLKTSTTGEGFMGALKVNDKMVLDSGVRNLGETTVSTIAPKQGQGTISGINATEVTITPFTDNCFKEGQNLVHVTPKPILVNPKTDVINSIAGNDLTFAGDKDLYQFTNGDAVYMCDAQGNLAAPVFTTSAIDTVGTTATTVGSPMENYNVKLSTGESIDGSMTQETWERLQADPNWNAINPDPNKVSPEPYFYITGTNRCRFQYTGADTTKDYFMLTDHGTAAGIYTFDLEGDIAPANGQARQFRISRQRK